MIYFKTPTDKELFEEYVDLVYMKYLHEAHGISTLLILVQQDIYNLILPHINKKEQCEIYTGYNWDFNYDDFIKINDENKSYPLYVNIYVSSNKKLQGYTLRDISKEKNGDTKIEIFISINCENILDTIIHELQHVREMYIKPNKCILACNSKNIYANPKLDKDIKNLYKDILYYMSDAEQHAHKQLVYSYVLNHPEIIDIDTNDPGLRDASGLKDFYVAWQAYYMYKSQILYIDFILELNLKFGMILKKNFKYKNSKLTAQYINNIKNNKEEYDLNIFYSIGEFIHNNIIKYLREVARIIYFSIEDRNNKNVQDSQEINEIFTFDE